MADAAGLNRDRGLLNAAASNAVSSGINPNAICHALAGRTGKTDKHSVAWGLNVCCWLLRT